MSCTIVVSTLYIEPGTQAVGPASSYVRQIRDQFPRAISTICSLLLVGIFANQGVVAALREMDCGSGSAELWSLSNLAI